jgi:predicted alpha/beta superfamily hydrolase
MDTSKADSLDTRSPLERYLSMTPTESLQRSTLFTVEPPRRMRADGYEWGHEVRVALPCAYPETLRTYPVLWVTDALLEMALSVLGVVPGGVDPIIVSVGPDAVPVREFARRRIYDFTPGADFYPAGAGGDHIRKHMQDVLAENSVGGGAGRFLDFLVDDVRPALAADYRMDPEDQALFGFSLGGSFVGYSLFARPGAFAKYICGSPALGVSGGAIFAAEEEYAATHDDLPAAVFFGAGDAEMTEPLIPGYGIVSSMGKLVETLSIRGYPSLRLTAKIFPGERHATAMHSVLSWGVRSLWSDAAGIP